MLEIMYPAGGLYQATRSSFLLKRRVAEFADDEPVAGAWISQQRITEEWSVRVSLDGKAITSQAAQLNP
jgi:hypothetical protein